MSRILRFVASCMLSLAMAGAGCGAPVTQILVFVTTDITPSNFATVRFSAIRGGATTPIVSRQLAGSAARWPLSFGVVANSPDDVRALLVTVEANYVSAGSTFTVRQQAIVSFAPNEIVRLDMQLNAACASMAGDRCGIEDLTCRMGSCVGRVREPLPRY